MKRYSPKDIEAKWQKTWDETEIYKTSEDNTKPKKYILEYFPYPSGSAMHVGHVRNYTIGDVTARFYRMRGYNVMHPMGWDSFGLPAENYAIKNNISPQQAILENTTKFKKQLTQMGFSYDWSREINSSDPKYYRWTQWFFKLLFDRGLAYQKESLQWWCDTDKTVLANEQVENGKCWRCGNEVTKKALKQWFFKITDYADRLVENLEDLDWNEGIKAMQRNWIGKSIGAEIDFSVDKSKSKITVFTTRADTIFSAAFMVLAPENPMVPELTAPDCQEEVLAYTRKAQAKSDIARMEENREKTGVFTGSYAINPANGEKIPIWVADFVLAGYGTGAVFGDIHDERDFEFAKKFKIPVRPTVLPEDAAEANKVIAKEYAFTGEGMLVDSGEFTGLKSSDAREKITKWLAKNGQGREKVNYKIRDWLISRQRYWGAPIPIIHCPEHGAVAVPEEQLPVELPEVESYQPTGEGKSVLASVTDWVNTTCPTCGKSAKRETDTMDGFACSSWYFLRFADPHNNKEPFDKEKVKYWLPVDDYIGGAEHAVMHLLYARMWTMVMHDAGLIDFDEPFSALRNQGMILAPDGRKMSKSWGNVIAPDDIISQGYGADSVRVMELFIGPWNQSAAWSIEGMGGTFRFLQRVWTLTQEYLENKQDSSDDKQAKELNVIMHKAVYKVSKDLETMGFNTAVSTLMESTNSLYKLKVDGFKDRETWQNSLVVLMQLLAPFAPHIAEELWEQLGQKGSVHTSNWPVHNPKYLVSDSITLAVQVNGKVRAEITVGKDTSKDEIQKLALDQENVKKYLENKKPTKVIYVPGRLVSIVV